MFYTYRHTYPAWLDETGAPVVVQQLGHVHDCTLNRWIVPLTCAFCKEGQ